MDGAICKILSKTPSQIYELEKKGFLSYEEKVFVLASLGTKAAEAFGEFEQGMKIVQTVSNQTGGAIRELGDQANQLSITYRTAIGDITDGLQTLGRAGLNSATTKLEVLESGLQTAKLEGRSLNGVLEELIQNTAMLG